MTDTGLSTERTRRSVIKHTGVGAFALAASTSSATAASPSGGGTRLLEAAITYEVLSEPSASNVELRSYTTCPGPTYHVEDSVVRIPASDSANGIGKLFEDDGQLINFGGLRHHEDGRLMDEGQTQSLVKSTLGSLRPYELWELAGDGTHEIPEFRIDTQPDGSIVTTEAGSFEVAVGGVGSQTLGVEQIDLSAVKFLDGAFDNPDIPDRELSQKYEHVRRRVEARPELTVSDRGSVELK